MSVVGRTADVLLHVTAIDRLVGPVAAVGQNFRPIVAELLLLALGTKPGERNTAAIMRRRDRRPDPHGHGRQSSGIEAS